MNKTLKKKLISWLAILGMSTSLLFSACSPVVHVLGKNSSTPEESSSTPDDSSSSGNDSSTPDDSSSSGNSSSTPDDSSSSGNSSSIPDKPEPDDPTDEPTEEPICIMSYNVRVADMNGSYGDRRVRVADMILQEMPDSFGVQEATPEWLTAISERVGEYYNCVGLGREANGGGEASAVYYRKDKYDLLATETKWLSPTPDVMGSRFEGEQYIRVVTYAVLQSKTNDVVYVHANTHLGLKEDNRLQQIEVLLEQIADYDKVYPTFVTGDFNDSAEHNAAFMMTWNGYINSRLEAPETDDHWTYPTPLYGGSVNEKKEIIDYCFHNGLGITVDRYRVLSQVSADGGWSSDHYPIVINGKINMSETSVPALSADIEKIEFSDKLTVQWGENLDEITPSVIATLSNGKKLPIPSYLCDLEKPSGKADIGSYTFSANLKFDRTISCKKTVDVSAILQAEDAILDGGAAVESNRKDQIEYVLNAQGQLVDSGRKVTYVGKMDNAVANGKTPTITFNFEAQAGDYTLNIRCSNTWWTFKGATSGTCSEVDLSRVLKLKVNGQSVQVKPSVQPAITGTYGEIGRTFFTLEMADITLKEGANTIVIEGFCDGYDKSMQIFNECPVPNIDYIEFVAK